MFSFEGVCVCVCVWMLSLWVFRFIFPFLVRLFVQSISIAYIGSHVILDETSIRVHCFNFIALNSTKYRERSVLTRVHTGRWATLHSQTDRHCRYIEIQGKK